MIIVIFGLPGVGKTTLAKKLSSKLNITRITAEDIGYDMFEVWKERVDRDPPKHEMEKIYNRIFELTENKVKQGWSVILDGIFRLKNQRNGIIKIARKYNTEIILLYIVCPENIVRERLIKRQEKGSKSPSGYKGYKSVKKVFEPIDGECHKIDTSKDIDKQIKFLL